MRKVILKNNVVIKLHDSIETLPQKQFIEFEKMLLIEAGVGDSFNDFDNHMSKILLFINKGKPEEAQKELMNMRQNIYFMFNDISIKSLAVACLIDSKNFSIDKAKETSEYLIKNGITNEQLSTTIEAIKKKYIKS